MPMRSFFAKGKNLLNSVMDIINEKDRIGKMFPNKFTEKLAFSFPT